MKIPCSAGHVANDTAGFRNQKAACGIVAVQGKNLDASYIGMWAKIMDITKEIDEIMTRKDLPNAT